MIKNIMKIIKLLPIVLLSLIMVQGCNPKKKNEKKEVLILYPNWAEGVAFTHLAKVALEDMGYAPKVKPIEPGPIYASLAKGDADLFLDAWLPNTHKEYWEKFGSKIDKIGEAFSGGTTGIVVPSYVEINSIEELAAYKDKFEGKIIGIGSGAGIHGNTEKAIEAYGLDYKQITSSGPAMLASLKKRIQRNEWVAITGWKPHFMWAQFDIKYLEDPKGVYPKDVCAILARKGFTKNFPELATFFSNFNVTEDQLYSLMAMIEKADSPEIAAQKWYKKNKDLVKSWMIKK
ncbi:glycine betaine/proline transport system substrate-binding protein [Ancylomarina subtilis]|uniref:Glycine betaine/proline transport system substrate-binding protein n=1 Tax=Ancylomarina subtilis TaxID=1639035 RepID=A0A4V2FRP2_9BACT|nr:glycine betaine ABC transporter substrate-binding protein [Ancylomarina subtilis]RZT91209.1 glycine betaine/proline transport system substrate-binding protein [Ancylomarina subtilis]